jgi:hypothetical protein
VSFFKYPKALRGLFVYYFHLPVFQLRIIKRKRTANRMGFYNLAEILKQKALS